MRCRHFLLLFSASSAIGHAQPSHEYPHDALPKSIGVVGVGTIASAFVRGILGAHLPYIPRFVLSPRDAKKAAELKKEFPDSVSIAEDDQKVIDTVDCVVLALPGSVAVNVLKNLTFHEEQQVVSLIAAIKFELLQDILGSRVNCTVAIPLPAMATQQGATLGYPHKSFAEAMFSAVGTYTAAASQDEFTHMQVAGSLMGDFYKRQLTLQEWMTSHGVPADKAAAYIGGVFATIAADSAHATPNTFAEKVSEQTPGGTNELVWKEQERAGVYVAVNKSLDSVYQLLNKTTHSAQAILV